MATEHGRPQDRRGWALPAALLAAALLLVGAVAYTAASPDGRGGEPARDGGARAGFEVPAVDTFGRRVEVPTNPEGHPLGQRRTAVAPAGAAPVKPDGLVWERTRYSPLPFSPQDGPSQVGPCRAEGFSHTPQGAAIASLHLGARWSHCDTEPLRRFVGGQVIATAEEVAAMWEYHTLVVRAGTAWSGTISTVPAPDAVRIRSYAPDFAVVEWAQRASAGTTWTVTGVAVAWRDEDWKLVPGRSPQRAHLTTLGAGWVQWA